ncbi:hypothetical protein R1flu_021688 [Riccia fluitans]|uniref:Altered inheritance of mitochondria protein 24, mitochondrial n=1 Tax=Riccia fluitans TaxID=41844 RepID=A0ABD1ZQG5_9MARC
MEGEEFDPFPDALYPREGSFGGSYMQLLLMDNIPDLLQPLDENFLTAETFNTLDVAGYSTENYNGVSDGDSQVSMQDAGFALGAQISAPCRPAGEFPLSGRLFSNIDVSTSSCELPADLGMEIKTYGGMRLSKLVVPSRHFVLKSMARFARLTSTPGGAVCMLEGTGSVCNLELLDPWGKSFLVAGDAQIVTMSRFFQADCDGFVPVQSSSTTIVVRNCAGELHGGVVKRDMQAVGQVVMNVYIFY